MGIKDRTIDVFEGKINELITIRDIRDLPQWTDADVIAAHCLIVEYRKITRRIQRR